MLWAVAIVPQRVQQSKELDGTLDAHRARLTRRSLEVLQPEADRLRHRFLAGVSSDPPHDTRNAIVDDINQRMQGLI